MIWPEWHHNGDQCWTSHVHQIGWIWWEEHYQLKVMKLAQIRWPQCHDETKAFIFLHASKKNWPYENFWPVCLCVKKNRWRGLFFFSPFFESFQVHSVGLVWWKKKSTKGSHSEKKTKKMGHFGVGGPSSLNHQTRPSRFCSQFSSWDDPTASRKAPKRPWESDGVFC